MSEFDPARFLILVLS